ncbi:MAG: PilZ domain-containing protein [Acidobacteria bacterium]|nr:PilZ domain-containing protein [Acidobacteriota bacterium]
MDRREHHRVQLRLPARLRWTTPFGQKTEVCTTVDISRGGMLLPCREPHAEGMPLWVTLPFDPSLTVGQPEILARVVRAVVTLGDEVAKKQNENGKGNGHHKNGNGNGNGHAHHHAAGAGVFRSPSATEAAAIESARRISIEQNSGAETVTDASGVPGLTMECSTLLALRFEILPRRQFASAHAIVPLRDGDRRSTRRRRFVVPVRVRTEHVPWFEETMTIDCSADGLKFRSNREYTRGEFLVVSFESVATSPWLGVTESLLMVVRVESEPDVAELQVAVCRTQQFAFRF